MKPERGLTWWVRIIGTVLAIGLSILLLGREDWKQVWETVKGISWQSLLLAFGLIMFSRFAVIGRWYVLLRSAEFEINLRKTANLTFAGLFASNFLPSTIGGDVVRLAGLMQEKSDNAVAAASIVVDRLIGMLGMALMLPFGAVQALQTWLENNGTTGIQGFAAIPWLDKLWQKGLNILKRLLRALSLWFKQPLSLVTSLFFTGLHMIGYFGAIWVMLDAMGEPIPFYLIASLWSLVYFITLVPISVNGFGLQEFSILTIFPLFGGISESSATAMALLFRLLVMLASLPGAFSLPGLLPEAKKQQLSDHLEPEIDEQS